MDLTHSNPDEPPAKRYLLLKLRIFEESSNQGGVKNEVFDETLPINFNLPPG